MPSPYEIALAHLRSQACKKCGGSGKVAEPSLGIGNRCPRCYGSGYDPHPANNATDWRLGEKTND